MTENDTALRSLIPALDVLTDFLDMNASPHEEQAVSIDCLRRIGELLDAHPNTNIWLLWLPRTIPSDGFKRAKQLTLEAIRTADFCTERVGVARGSERNDHVGASVSHTLELYSSSLFRTSFIHTFSSPSFSSLQDHRPTPRPRDWRDWMKIGLSTRERLRICTPRHGSSHRRDSSVGLT